MKSQNKRSKILITIISIIMFLLGLLIFLYPTISNIIANKQYEKTINNYEEEYKEITKEDLSNEYEKAIEYNNALIGKQVSDEFIPGTGYVLPKNYEELLNISGNGVMGYIEIPKISIQIPIYHGTDEETLTKGIGHLKNSALPIGGEGNNPVLTGHRGLPKAELFTRLDEMKKGDLVYIHVLNDTLAYEIDNIITIDPKDTKHLNAHKEKDMITLITCTPYSVNTHRLVVQGHRVPYVEAEKEKIETTHVIMLNEDINIRMIGILIGLIIVIMIIILIKKKQPKKEVIAIQINEHKEDKIINTNINKEIYKNSRKKKKKWGKKHGKKH